MSKMNVANAPNINQEEHKMSKSNVVEPLGTRHTDAGVGDNQQESVTLRDEAHNAITSYNNAKLLLASMVERKKPGGTK
jgi:hypothetical protein